MIEDTSKENNRKVFLKIFLPRLPSFQAVFRAVEASVMKDDFREPILDLGCGDGIFAEAVVGKGKNLYGVDINRGALDEAKEKGIYRQLVYADAEELPFSNGQFQTVISNSVLEHIKNIRQVLKETARVLKKDGSLVLSAPSEKREELWLVYRIFKGLGLKKIAKFLGRKENWLFKHYNLWSGKKWQRELKLAGFRKVNYTYCGGAGTALISDLLLVFSPIGAFERFFFKRYLAWRKKIAPLLYWFLHEAHDKVDDRGGCVIIVWAQK